MKSYKHILLQWEVSRVQVTEWVSVLKWASGVFNQFYARIPEKTITFKSKVEEFILFHGMLCQFRHRSAVFKKLDFACIKYLKSTAEETH